MKRIKWKYITMINCHKQIKHLKDIDKIIGMILYFPRKAYLCINKNNFFRQELPNHIKN